MYSVVMIPTDGSDWSRHAIPLALAVARPAKATLHVVSVLEPTFTAPIYGVPIAGGGLTGAVLVDPSVPAEAKSAHRNAQEAALRTFAEQLAEASGVAVTASLQEGDVAEALRRYTEAHDVDLVVMATHGRGGLARAVLGSVADALLHAVRCPLLLTRPHGELPREGEAASITHVLVPLDGTAESGVILTHASELAAMTGARCTLLHVSRPEVLKGVVAPDALRDPEAAQRREEADEAYLERMAELVRARTSAVSTALIHVRTPTNAIIDYAGTHAVDLIAMTTHAPRGFERVMLGSTATALLKKTRLPMLLAHSDTPR